MGDEVHLWETMIDGCEGNGEGNGELETSMWGGILRCMCSLGGSRQAQRVSSFPFLSVMKHPGSPCRLGAGLFVLFRIFLCVCDSYFILYSICDYICECDCFLKLCWIHRV